MQKLKLNDEDYSFSSFAPVAAQFKVQEGFVILYLIGYIRVHLNKIYKGIASSSFMNLIEDRYYNW